MDTSTQIAAATTGHRWTRAQYERMIEAGILGEDDHVELINGEIVPKSPQGSPHATATGLVEDALRMSYASTETIIRTQMPLALGQASEPEPDLAVVRGSRRDYPDAHPSIALLVVEAADSSAAYDRTTKQALYAAHEVPEYWIVDLGADHVEVYRSPSGKQYEEKTTLRRGDEVEPPAGKRGVAVADLLP